MRGRAFPGGDARQENGPAAGAPVRGARQKTAECDRMGRAKLDQEGDAWG